MSNNSAYPGALEHGAAGSDFAITDFIVRQIVGKISTSTLVQVTAVNSGAGTVDIHPMVAQLDGSGQPTPHGTIFGVPYLRVQGGTNAVIIDPIVGDIGLAVIASHDISRVKRTRTSDSPGSRRRFSLSDALYVGGFLNGQPQQFLQIGDAGVTITSANGLPVTINAPGGATVNGDATVTGNMHIEGDVTTGAGSTFNGKSFDSHTHGGVAAGTATSGPPS